MILSRRSSLVRFAGFLFCACLLSCCGCGEQEKPPAPAPEPPKPPKEPSVVEVEGLPELEELFGPKLDGGRIQVPTPKGWFIRPRSSKHVIRFHPTRETMYPSIIVTATDYDGLEAVSEENVDEFARRISGALMAEGLDQKLVLPVAPIKVGDVSGVSYRRRGKREGKVFERLFIETVFAGRKYSYELRARTGTLSQYRPYLMAVVAFTDFHDAESGEADAATENP